jgi:hypothetical protein
MEIIYVRSAGKVRNFELNLVQGLAGPGDKGCSCARRRIRSAITGLRGDHIAMLISYDRKVSNHQKVPIATLKTSGFGLSFVILK